MSPVRNSPRAVKTHTNPKRPYRDPSAGDLIIRTSDSREFFVERSIIANASPRFILVPSGRASLSDRDKPVIVVAETGAIWSKLLAFFYLLSDERLLPLDTIRALLKAADKYEIAAVTKWMERMLRHPDHLEKEPLCVYAVACAHNLRTLARDAAWHCLCFPVEDAQPDALELISALQYTRLLDYRKRCAAAAADAVLPVIDKVPGWVVAHKDLVGVCSGCCGNKDIGGEAVAVSAPGTSEVLVYLRVAWYQYLEELSGKLLEGPDPSLAGSLSMLTSVIGSVAACEGCRENIAEHTAKFSRITATRIESAISEVVLEL
ncbi:hypothetical protein BD413DRAFT_614624 [Trametes elegans]|nr:hypothetical protein BD413DRAFT_614624 [Trametes elegans]